MYFYVQISLDMVKSMTGYGKAEALLEGGRITVEIRTLNGKNSDVSIKTSLFPRDKDLYVRQKIAKALQRGTIDVFATWEPSAGESARTINVEAVKDYYTRILDLRNSLQGFSMANISTTDRINNEILAAILRFPDVVDTSKKEVVSEENWPVVEEAIDRALAAVEEFRIKEGEALRKDVVSRVGNILSFEDEVESLAPERLAAVRERLRKNLEELSQKCDEARFEQEMVYYLEKLDINEENVRLRQHCKYFIDTLDGDPAPGRKLGFIIQEMGREINTTGSKANDTAIQKLVVRMKDELEKVREQSMNIL